MLNAHRTALEQFTRALLARLTRFVPWEPVESVRSFVEVLTPCVVDKMESELPMAVRKGRVEELEKRTFRWIEKSFWEDIRQHPDDPIDKRTLRLKKLFDAAPAIPPRRGDSEHFPISVFIEYDSLRKLLEPVFKRRPAPVRSLAVKQEREFVSLATQGERVGMRRSIVLKALNDKRFQRWKTELLERARRIIPVDCWPKTREAWFTEDALFELTAHKAALAIIGVEMNLSNDAVWKLVEKGKEMLPPRILEKAERAHAGVESNDAWEFFNDLDPLK